MIVFDLDGWLLQNPDEGIYVTSSDVYSMPSVELDSRTLAEQDGSILLNKRLENKYITLDGNMIKDTIEELDGLIDRLKVQVNKVGVILGMTYAGKRRIYQVTVQSLTVNRRRGLSQARYRLTFFSQYPFGADEDLSNVMEEDLTLGSHLFEAYIEGNYPASPNIRVSYSALTEGLNATVSIQNASNFIGISITRDWLPGDILELDTFNKTVVINGAISDFDGRFPSWNPGSGALAYTDSFTSRTGILTAQTIIKYI